jgi:hypothetical protein
VNEYFNELTNICFWGAEVWLSGHTTLPPGWILVFPVLKHLHYLSYFYPYCFYLNVILLFSHIFNIHFHSSSYLFTYNLIILLIPVYMSAFLKLLLFTILFFPKSFFFHTVICGSVPSLCCMFGKSSSDVSSDHSLSLYSIFHYTVPLITTFLFVCFFQLLLKCQWIFVFNFGLYTLYFSTDTAFILRV